MVSTSLVIFILSASSVLTQKTPTISFISGPEVVTDIGGEVELKCKTENAIAYPINWMKISGENGQNIMTISTGKTLIMRSDRYKLIHEHADSAYILKITGIQAIDAAKYRCQVLVGINKSVTKEVIVQVRLPPMIKENSTMDLTTKSGELLELKCEASGFPKPVITWTKMDGGVLPSGKKQQTGNPLVIKKVKKEDRGKYQCEASNGVGATQTHSMEVSVKSAPEIVLPIPRVHQAAYYDAVLVCNVNAYPTPSIIWTLNGNEIVNDYYHEVIHFAKEEGLTISSVKMSSIQPDQFGVYTCSASNVEGASEQQIELAKTNIPVPPAPYGAASSSKVLPGLIFTALLYLVL